MPDGTCNRGTPPCVLNAGHGGRCTDQQLPEATLTAVSGDGEVIWSCLLCGAGGRQNSEAAARSWVNHHRESGICEQRLDRPASETVADDVVMSDGAAEPPRSDPYRWNFAEAEKLMRAAAEMSMPPNPQSELARQYIAAAQARATLAVAAATDWQNTITREHTNALLQALTGQDDLQAKVGEAVRRTANYDLPDDGLNWSVYRCSQCGDKFRRSLPPARGHECSECGAVDTVSLEERPRSLRRHEHPLDYDTLGPFSCQSCGTPLDEHWAAAGHDTCPLCMRPATCAARVRQLEAVLQQFANAADGIGDGWGPPWDALHAALGRAAELGIRPPAEDD